MEIAKIIEIFENVVDHNGDLKVFKNFDWDKNKDKVVMYVDKQDTINQKYLNKQQTNQSNYHENGLVYYYTNKLNGSEHLCHRSNIKDWSNSNINVEKFDDIIGKSIEEFDTHFSILLNKFEDLTKDDFVILYKAFYEILKLAEFNFEEKGYGTLYKNIFKKVIDYFLEGKMGFVFYDKNSNENSLDEDIQKKLKEAYDKYIEYIKTLSKLNKNTIYYGAPGTGKTYGVKKLLEILGLNENSKQVKWIQFHPNYSYEDFIDGIKPIGFNGGNLELGVVLGEFKSFCKKVAKKNKKREKEKKENENLEEKPYFFIIDEINRADLSLVFGETLSLIEDEYRGKENAIRTKNSMLIENLKDTDGNKIGKDYSVLWEKDESKFYIPKNIYFIGMMNDVDKSIDSFDLALRRRFTWKLKECDYDLIDDNKDNCTNYKDRCKKLNEFITGVSDKQIPNSLNLGRAYEIGHSYFLKESSLEDIFENHIKPILQEYIRSNFDDSQIDENIKIAREIFVEGK